MTFRVTEDANHDIEVLVERQVELTGGMPSAAPLCEPECAELELCFNQLGNAICACVAGTERVEGICTHLCDPPCGQLAMCVEGAEGHFCQCMEGVDPENGDCVAP